MDDDFERERQLQEDLALVARLQAGEWNLFEHNATSGAHKVPRSLAC